MKLFMIGADITTLAMIAGAVLNLIPTVAGVIATILAAVYYGFLVYDRIKYGPQLTTHHRTDSTDG